ncbi:MAG TPA: tRNA (guanosine(37)-N1)-methyltransferase TrmD [Rhizomicrobium sp.]
MSWKATILTLFPSLFPGVLDASLIGQARNRGLWSLDVRDIREHGIGRHRTVDDTPAGGGPGMVMRADVAAAAINAARAGNPEAAPIYLSPRGARLDQHRVKGFARSPGVLLLCGRFEGLDQRAIEACGLEEISLGDFVLAGGEIAAMALVEACVRLLPGVLGCETSGEQESFEQGLLEYPHYTRPAEFQGREIPTVLLSGHHGEIERWRRAEAEALTKTRRPDLWSLYERRRG